MKNQSITKRYCDQLIAIPVLSRRSLVGMLALGMACIPHIGLAQDTTNAVTPRIVTDCRGRRVTVHSATRIASIGGNLTETLYALGNQVRFWRWTKHPHILSKHSKRKRSWLHARYFV